MNADRRKRLQDLIAELHAIQDEEQDAHDNLPESFQYSERGEKMQECCDAIGNAIDELEAVAE